jgi:hypothetical protein
MLIGMGQSLFVRKSVVIDIFRSTRRAVLNIAARYRKPLRSAGMEVALVCWASSVLFMALLMFAARDAVAWESVVFQAADLPHCQQGPWKAVGNDKNGSLIGGTFLGFKGCADESGFHGDGTPNDPYRLALDGVSESVEIDGLEATTRADYTVHVWFRIKGNKSGLTMLVDSRTDPFYVPLRMRISEGKLQCSIEMPFPDRIYVASSPALISPSNWYYGACRLRVKSRELSVFLNGSLRGSTGIPPGSIRTNRIRIGGDPSVDGENFAGDIAEVVFSQKSEDADAIRARCRQESQRFAGAKCRK